MTGRASSRTDSHPPKPAEQTSRWRSSPARLPRPTEKAVRPGDSGGDHARARLAALIGVLLVPIMGLTLYRTATTKPLAERDLGLRERSASTLPINPNTAPWWELTVIPGLGEVTAKRIVEFREARRPAGRNPEGRLVGASEAFGCAADLQQVRGIGPKTVQRMQPFLTFERPLPGRHQP